MKDVEKENFSAVKRNMGNFASGIQEYRLLPEDTGAVEELVRIEIDMKLGYCCGCQELRDDINKSRNNALVRQIAIYLEMDLKLSCIDVDPALKDQHTDLRRRLNMARIVHSKLQDMVEDVKRDGYLPDLLRVRNCDEGTFFAILKDLHRMKIKFNNEAHPTSTLEGEPVTFDHCRDLVQSCGVVSNVAAIIKQIGLIGRGGGSAFLVS